MKLNFAILMISTLCLLGGLSPEPAFAQEKPAVEGEKDKKEMKKEKRGKKGMRGRRGQRFLETLNLNDEQKEKIKKIRKEKREQNRSKREDVKKKKGELRDAMKSDSDDKKLLSLFNAMQGAKSDLAKIGFETMLKIRSVLTPEQRKKFTEHRAERDFKDSKFGKRRRPRTKKK